MAGDAGGQYGEVESDATRSSGDGATAGDGAASAAGSRGATSASASAACGTAAGSLDWTSASASRAMSRTVSLSTRSREDPYDTGEALAPPLATSASACARSVRERR